MPRARSSDNVLTIGWIGTGAPDEDNDFAQFVNDQLEEHLEAAEKDGLTEVKFLIPVTSDGFTDELAAIIDYADEAKIDYETITVPTETLPRAYKKHLAGALKSHALDDAFTGLVQMLAKAPHGELVIIWDADEDAAELMEDYANVALGAGLPVYDLLDQMSLVELSGDDEEGGGAETEATEEVASGAYTDADLEEMEIPALKEIAKGLAIAPVPRTKAGLIEKILDAQPTAGELEPTDEAVSLPEDTEPVASLSGAVGLPDDFWDRLHKTVHTATTQVLKDHGIVSSNGKSAPAAEDPAEEAEASAAPRRRGRPPKDPVAAAPAPTARRGPRRA